MFSSTKGVVSAVAGASFVFAAAIGGQVAHAGSGSAERVKVHDVCRYEDGSGQRVCVWPAGSVGNGVGDSFIAIHGGTDRAKYVYISDEKAYRLTH